MESEPEFVRCPPMARQLGGRRPHCDGHGASRLPFEPDKRRAGDLAGDVLESSVDQCGRLRDGPTPWGAVAGGGVDRP